MTIEIRCQLDPVHDPDPFQIFKEFPISGHARLDRIPASDSIQVDRPTGSSSESRRAAGGMAGP
jgi:hypothetical protein